MLVDERSSRLERMNAAGGESEHIISAGRGQGLKRRFHIFFSRALDDFGMLAFHVG
jgi:hypothetical protein